MIPFPFGRMNDRLTILIADDHQLFREGMASLLQKLPYNPQIFHAENGARACDVAVREKPDIIFMDIRMPELTGIEATRKITEAGLPCKVIALTMMEDPHHVVTMIKAGAVGYLLKNTSFAELSEAIGSVMEGKRFYSRAISADIMERLTSNGNTQTQLKRNYELTDREMEIVGLVCRGFSNKNMAEMLDISVKTIESHRKNIYEKLGVNNTADLATYAIQERLVTLG